MYQIEQQDTYDHAGQSNNPQGGIIQLRHHDQHMAQPAGIQKRHDAFYHQHEGQGRGYFSPHIRNAFNKCWKILTSSL